MFEFAEPVGGDVETELVFTLEQLHGGGHLIGRFRLSLTDAALPVKVAAVPPGAPRRPRNTRREAARNSRCANWRCTF